MGCHQEGQANSTQSNSCQDRQIPDLGIQISANQNGSPFSGSMVPNIRHPLAHPPPPPLRALFPSAQASILFCYEILR